jgi:hypothetical protein
MKRQRKTEKVVDTHRTVDTERVIQREISSINNVTTTKEIEYIKEKKNEQTREILKTHIHKQIERLQTVRSVTVGITQDIIKEWFVVTRKLVSQAWYDPLFRWKPEDILDTSPIINTLFNDGCVHISSFTWQEIIAADLGITEMDIIYILMEKAILGRDVTGLYPRVEYANTQDVKNGDLCEWFPQTLDLDKRTMMGRIRIMGKPARNVTVRYVDYPLLCILAPHRQEFFLKHALEAGTKLLQSSTNHSNGVFEELVGL